MPTADKLITVAENVPKVYHAGQLNVIENTSTLKKSVSGSALLINDVSPVTHDMSVKVRSKNLIPYPYTNTTKTDYGITFTVNDDRSITISGKAEGEAYFYLCVVDFGSEHMWNEAANSNGYYVSGCTHFFYNKNNKVSTIVIPSGTDYSTNPITVKPQIELGTTATDYTPYVPDLTAVKVTRQGKNLFSGLTKGIGIDLTTIDEIVNSNYSATDYIPVDFNANTYYYISGLPSTISNCVFAYNANKEFLGRTGGNPLAERKLSNNSFASGTPQGEGDIAYLRVTCFKISTSAGTVDDIDDAKIQLEIGSIATDYKPYNSATFTPTADGVVNGVTSLYPNTTLTTDTDGVIIDCEYYKDIDVNDIIERKVTAYTNPKIKTVGYSAFQNCKVLASVNLPNVTYIDGAGFMNCELLKFVNIPNVTNINGAAFQNCNALTSINLPSVTTMSSAVFYNCTSLITVDFSAITNFTGGVFANCKALKTVVIRNNTMCTLGTTSAFSNCTLINGTGGYIYVPSSLIDTYKTATNWVTYASKFRALEDYTVDGTTTGALDESKVSA